MNVLDLGCGNGRHALLLAKKNTFTTCLDISRKQLSMAKTNLKDIDQVNFVQADLCNLPFNDNSYDVIISTAVIHHLSTPNLRTKSIDEMIRILKPDGLAMITVWSKEHKRFQKNENGEIRGVEVVGPSKEDVTVSWSLKEGVKVKRYYHLFVRGELDELCNNKCLSIINSTEKGGNFVVVVKKGHTC